MRRSNQLPGKTCLGIITIVLCVFGSFCFSWGAESEAKLTTIAGVPGNGYQEGMREEAYLASPRGLDVKNGMVVIADTDNNLIRGYGSNRVVLMAGSQNDKDAYGNPIGGYMDSSFNRALFNNPFDCLYLENDTIAVADRDNHAIRVVGKSGVYTINGTAEQGYAEGRSGEAKFSYPSGLAKGRNGKFYVADTGNHCIRIVDSKGVTSLVAGVPGTGGFRDGAVGEALFLEPTSVVMAEDGCIYVADSGNQRIRKIADGQVTTLAGGAEGFYLDTEYRQPGSDDGQGQAARFWFPEGICMAGQVVIVADTGNHVIRAISPSGQVQVIVGNGEAGYQDGDKLTAMLNRPSDVAWENGILYIMDSGNSALRTIKFDPEKWMESLTP